jgi:glycosyltransferase involved in cell wall biosynthesis
VLEAMTRGAPVIPTNAGGTGEVAASKISVLQSGSVNGVDATIRSGPMESHAQRNAGDFQTTMGRCFSRRPRAPVHSCLLTDCDTDVGSPLTTKRILHVVGSMNRGGVETWLMHVLRRNDPQRCQMDFLVHTDEPGAYDAEARAHGSRIIHCPHASRPASYAINLRKILREYGPYDVVHSHVHHYSGYVLRVACRAGVPMRIAHSHLDTAPAETHARLVRRMYLALMTTWIDRYATVGLAASAQAAAALFGRAWSANPRWSVLYYGIDLRPFRSSVDPLQVRAELGIPAKAYVVGHIGRFDPQKNHDLFVEIAAQIAQRDRNAYFLLVGDGPLRHAVQQKVASLGLADRFVFTGVRSDVATLMMGAMDLFLLPSLYEGLPLVALEAQAAGLPTVLSDTIAPEVEVDANLTKRLSLSQPAADWALTVLGLRRDTTPQQRDDALRALETSRFNIETAARCLQCVYCG